MWTFPKVIFFVIFSPIFWALGFNYHFVVVVLCSQAHTSSLRLFHSFKSQISRYMLGSDPDDTVAQWFSSVIWGPSSVSETLPGVPQGQNYLKSDATVLFAFSLSLSYKCAVELCRGYRMCNDGTYACVLLCSKNSSLLMSNMVYISR